jgi:hypothetical protein
MRVALPYAPGTPAQGSPSLKISISAGVPFDTALERSRRPEERPRTLR